jgi:hypothetical protein
VAHDEIERAQLRQFVARHLALDPIREVRLDRRGSDVLAKESEMARVVGLDVSPLSPVRE